MKELIIEIDDMPTPNDNYPRMVRRIIDLLDTMPPYNRKVKLLTMRTLASRLGVQVHSLHQYSGHPAMADYTAMPKQNKGRLWGHPAAIKAFKEQL